MLAVIKRLSWIDFLTASLVSITQFIDVHIWHPWQLFAVLLYTVAQEHIVTELVDHRPISWRLLALKLLVYTSVAAPIYLMGHFAPRVDWLALPFITVFTVLHLRGSILAFSKAGLMKEEGAKILEGNFRARLNPGPPETPAA